MNNLKVLLLLLLAGTLCVFVACGDDDSSFSLPPNDSGDNNADNNNANNDISPNNNNANNNISPDNNNANNDNNDNNNLPGVDDLCLDPYIYIVEESTNAIWSFDPERGITEGLAALEKIGVPKCPTDDSPNSMTIDRERNAWINYGAIGKIYKVSLDTLECTETPYVSGGNVGFTPNISLSFSRDPSGQEDTLFISDHTGDDAYPPVPGKGVAALDHTSLAGTLLGDFSGELQGDRCELTGTGDGKLYGFFAKNPAVLAEINKTDGTTPSPIALQDGSEKVNAIVGGYAFAFWGGNFWFFTAPSDNPHNDNHMSTLTRYNPAAPEGQRLSIIIPDVGFVVVGAGVSTCAPIKID
ncbi:MAG: hypothetical protein GX146_02710 [Myxococcales bacterium]|jgi:hypothetical protein|nr:hypothetical protein [Myxococcales bacterium]